MPCDTRLRRGQTTSQRKEEVKKAISAIDSLLARGSVRAVVGRQGGIAFTGLDEATREGVTDGCIFRQIMAYGSTAAKAAVARAEAMAGRGVDRALVAQGFHSHDNGHNWHNKG